MHPELDPKFFEKFEHFRKGVRADAAAKSDWRVDNAGFQSELDYGKRRWDELLVDRNENAGLYVVVSKQKEIIGLLLIRRSDSNHASYAQVLYRRREHRQGACPDAVLREILDWLCQNGVREVTTGDVRGPTFVDHVMRCGFSLSAKFSCQ